MLLKIAKFFCVLDPVDNQEKKMRQRRIPGITKGYLGVERGSPGGDRARRSWTPSQAVDWQPGQGERCCVLGG